MPIPDEICEIIVAHTRTGAALARVEAIRRAALDAQLTFNEVARAVECYESQEQAHAQHQP